MMRCEYYKRQWGKGCAECSLAPDCEIPVAFKEHQTLFSAMKEKLVLYRKFFKTCANVDYKAALEGLTAPEHTEPQRDARVEMSRPGFMPVRHRKCGEIAFQIWLGANASTPFTPEYVRKPDGSEVKDDDPIMCYSCSCPVDWVAGINFTTHTIG
jgi:hypothetical protein